MGRSYTQRRLLRRLEKGWTWGDGLLNRLATSTFNPLYHLGTLSIFLLIVLAVTGLYVTIFYRPGAERAYATVAGMSASWLGSLMRTAHRYAADALVLVILLHALKMLLGDRFWGSRWLAWGSGWGLLVLVWIIGVMGYWLVWDQQAQWLTEYGIGLLKGPVAMPFLNPEIAARTFSFFVIVLFLHIFLSILIVLGVLVHVLRLSRARYWSPRWLMVEAGAALVLLAFWRPVSSAPPADLSRLVGTVTLDGWYLGFLPLAAQWGNVPFWGLATFLLGGLTVLPWLARGRDLGPAVVTQAACSGCALCFQQCPYEAIDMRPRADQGRFEYEAVVNPALCTGCGLCVGTCSTAGIELAGLPTAVVLEGLRRSLADARAADLSPVVVFTCQRHAALGTLGSMGAEEQRSKGAGEIVPSPHLPHTPAPVALGLWGSSNPHPTTSIITCSVPCVGMVQSEWVRESLAEGAQSVAILSCPADDCAFREGPRWLAQRLGRYCSLVRRGVRWLEAAPGDRGVVTALLQEAEGGKEKGEGGKGKKEKGGKGEKDSVFPPLPSFSPVSRSLFFPPLRSLAAGLVVLALAFGVSLAVERPATATSMERGVVRVVLVHPGKFKAASSNLPPEVQTKLPASVSPEQVLGGERFPVRLRVEIDGRPVVERVYRPGGLRREGQVYGLESWSVPPGEHQVRLWLMDDETTWRPVFSGIVEVKPGRVRTLTYDEEAAGFDLARR